MSPIADFQSARALQVTINSDDLVPTDIAAAWRRRRCTCRSNHDISGSFDSNFEFFAAILLFIAVANLAGVVPSVSGGLGPFEFFGAVSLVAMGVADAEAGAFVLTVHVALLVPVTIAGGIVLFMDGTSIRSLFSGARAAPLEGEASGTAEVSETGR